VRGISNSRQKCLPRSFVESPQLRPILFPFGELLEEELWDKVLLFSAGHNLKAKQPDPFESGCSNSFCHSA